MKYCIFLKNHYYIFCVHSGSLGVSHSFIDHSLYSFSTSIAVSATIKNSFTDSNADLPLIAS